MHWKEFFAVDSLEVLHTKYIHVICNVVFSEGGWEMLVEIYYYFNGLLRMHSEEIHTRTRVCM